MFFEINENLILKKKNHTRRLKPKLEIVMKKKTKWYRERETDEISQIVRQHYFLVEKREREREDTCMFDNMAHTYQIKRRIQWICWSIGYNARDYLLIDFWFDFLSRVMPNRGKTTIKLTNTFTPIFFTFQSCINTMFPICQFSFYYLIIILLE